MNFQVKNPNKWPFWYGCRSRDQSKKTKSWSDLQIFNFHHNRGLTGRSSRNIYPSVYQNIDVLEWWEYGTKKFTGNSSLYHLEQLLSTLCAVSWSPNCRISWKINETLSLYGQGFFFRSKNTLVITKTDIILFISFDAYHMRHIFDFMFWNL